MILNDENDIEFSDLRSIINITNEKSFQLYIDDIFRELLSSRISKKGNLGISKRVFIDYTRLPIFIAEKLYKSLLIKEEKELLVYESFSNFLKNLYMGSFQITARLIFEIYDFDKDGIIWKSDIKHLLCFLPLKDTEDNKHYHVYQMECLAQLDEYLKLSFKESEKMDFEEFLTGIENRSGEIFLQLVCFLYIILPITNESILLYNRFYKMRSSRKDSYDSSGSLLSLPQIYSPKITINKKSQLSPLVDFFALHNTKTIKMRVNINRFKTQMYKRSSTPDMKLNPESISTSKKFSDHGLEFMTKITKITSNEETATKLLQFEKEYKKIGFESFDKSGDIPKSKSSFNTNKTISEADSYQEKSSMYSNSYLRSSEYRSRSKTCKERQDALNLKALGKDSTRIKGENTSSSLKIQEEIEILEEDDHRDHRELKTKKIYNFDVDNARIFKNSPEHMFKKRISRKAISCGVPDGSTKNTSNYFRYKDQVTITEELGVINEGNNISPVAKSSNLSISNLDRLDSFKEDIEKAVGGVISILNQVNNGGKDGQVYTTNLTILTNVPNTEKEKSITQPLMNIRKKSLGLEKPLSILEKDDEKEKDSDESIIKFNYIKAKTIKESSKLDISKLLMERLINNNTQINSKKNSYNNCNDLLNKKQPNEKNTISFKRKSLKEVSYSKGDGLKPKKKPCRSLSKNIEFSPFSLHPTKIYFPKAKTTDELNEDLLIEYEGKLRIQMKEDEKNFENQLEITQGELYKFNKEKQTFNLYYVRLIYQCLYYYKSKNDNEEDYNNMHYLIGSFVKKKEPKTYKGVVYCCFKLTFNNNKTKKYYHKDEKTIKKWVEAINKANNYKDFFSDYRLGNLLGKGQYGVVKTAFHKKTSKKVALKIINKEDIPSFESMKTEIEVLKICKHPNIVHYHDYYENSEMVFIVMEYLSDGNLEEYLKDLDKEMSEKKAAEIIHQIASGLYYLKQFGIIHRDLKPTNIMISYANKNQISCLEQRDINIKIMDFGFSKILGPSEKVNETCGTLAFIAPEILLNKYYDFKVDIWSLGIVIYKIIFNTLPFMHKKDFDEIKKGIISTDKIKIVKKWEAKTEEVRDLILRCLQKNSEDRISIEELMMHPWFKLFEVI